MSLSVVDRLMIKVFVGQIALDWPEVACGCVLSVHVCACREMVVCG